LPCTSPASDVPRRRRGHHTAGSKCRRRSLSGASHLTMRAPSVLTRVTKDRPAPVPCGTKRAKVGTPSVVSRSTGLPQTPSRACLVDRECHAATRTVLTPRLAPAACVSTPCGAPLGQRRADDLPCGSSCVTARDASDRLLPSHVFVRAPAPRRLPAFLPGNRLVHAREIRFGGPHFRFLVRRERRCLPLAMCADALLTSPSRLLPGPFALARLVSCKSRQDRYPPARVKRYVWESGPRCLPYDKDRCPAASFRTPGSGLRCRAVLPPRSRVSTPFYRLLPFRARSALAPVHAFRCHRVRASLSLGDACRLLQPEYDARAHPTSLRSSHASGALAPLLAGTNRCRLRWSFDEFLVHRGPASHDLPRQAMGRDAREKARRDSRTIFARALLVASRAPGSPARLFARSGVPAYDSLRPRSLRERHLAKGNAARNRIEVPSAGMEPLRDRAVLPARARRDRGPVTPPPWRHCSGVRAPFVSARYRLPLTRKAMAAARLVERRKPKPLRNRRAAAPATASTTESARGLTTIRGPTRWA